MLKRTRYVSTHGMLLPVSDGTICPLSMGRDSFTAETRGRIAFMKIKQLKGDL